MDTLSPRGQDSNRIEDVIAGFTDKGYNLTEISRLFSSIMGDGHMSTAVSVDRVDFSGGYTPDNVVLCAVRINSIKMDVALEEMREWMPGWYKRVLAEVKTGRLLIRDI